MKKALLIILLALPAFILMLRSGIYTMHDFHLFRQFEFNQCISEGVFPCRWAPDAAKGYGEPLFNFYGQVPYWLGQVFIFIGFSVIAAVKTSFILSLVLSGLTMYLLASRFWGPRGALISAVFYMYAPYRAVDVWVRGALPESLGFIFFPLILYLMETKRYLLLALSLALLLTTHNLSLFMFLPFFALWWLIRSRDWKVIMAGLGSLLLSAFYLLPVIFESHLVTLTETTQNYYTYSHHFTSLAQLFVSRFWGYGGSAWGPNDSMSFSVGHLHWLLPLVSLVFIALRRHRLTRMQISLFILSIALALVALFLTHGKSDFIWRHVPGLTFVQFPWRFLSLSTLFLSLAAGIWGRLLPRILLPALLLIVILVNFNFFRPDIWKPISDSQAFNGPFWDEQRSSALADYWPKASPKLPQTFAPARPSVDFGAANVLSSRHLSHSSRYELYIEPPYAKVTFPVVYFPGWTVLVNGEPVPITPAGDYGLISLRIPEGAHTVQLTFKDTLPRSLGNWISIISLVGLSLFLVKYAKK